MSQNELISSKDKRKKEKLLELADHDIVLTTYLILESDSALPAIHWNRIALDEMQEVPIMLQRMRLACRCVPPPR